MRFYTGQHQHYCGVDLHARTLYVCVLDSAGKVLVQRNLPASPDLFLEVILPYSDNLVVGVECMFTWYWLADLCREAEIPFVLGHALYMKAIHGAKAKNDRIDAYKIASLLRGGNFPLAYVYPKEWRSTRDLLRRRLYLVRKRGELVSHIQNTYYQYNQRAPSAKLRYRSNREGAADPFPDLSVKKTVAVDLSVADHLDQVLRDLELFLTRRAKVHDADTFHRLRSVPGIGKILAMTILYEVHDIERFARVQDFASYARLVKCAHESAGKRSGTGGAKIGNVHLKWAFSEAAVLFVRHDPRAQELLQRLTRKHGKGKALSILAHKLGRAVYFMLKRNKTFEMDKFMAA